MTQEAVTSGTPAAGPQLTLTAVPDGKGGIRHQIALRENTYLSNTPKSPRKSSRIANKRVSVGKTVAKPLKSVSKLPSKSQSQQQSAQQPVIVLPEPSSLINDQAADIFANVQNQQQIVIDNIDNSIMNNTQQQLPQTVPVSSDNMPVDESEAKIVEATIAAFQVNKN